MKCLFIYPKPTEKKHFRFGYSINITYCYWVLLGLGYAMCFGKPGDDIKHE